MRLILAFLVCLFTASTAHAHYNAWNDGEFDYNLAYPDTWKEQGGLPGDGRIKMMAPGADGASCTVFAKQDRRFVIYPRDYMLDVVAQEIQWSYWEQAVANYDDLYFYYDNYGALGGGDARYTLVDYIDRTTEPGIRKRALIFATLYGDLHMMTMCSSPIETFDSHVTDFGQITDSIQMKPRYTPNIRGYYRDFLETKEYNHHWYEPIVMFFYPLKTMAKVVNCPRSEDYDACLSKRKPLPIRTR
ncbi:MAG: hypothetical protein JWM96_28 [Alphaproteobacteria bacterium]|nr:hypothetical protein [Alphaproteobacteria bacterium]